MEAVIEPGAPSAVRSQEPVILRRRWRGLVQGFFIAFLIASVVQFVLAYHTIDRSYLTEDIHAWPRADRVVAGLDELGVSHDLPGYIQLGMVWISTIAAVAFAVLILVRKPGEVLPMIVGTFIVAACVATYPPDITEMAKDDKPRAILASITTLPFPAGLVLLPFIFPDGRFTPRWTAIPISIVLAWLVFDFIPWPRTNQIGSGWVDAILLVAIGVLALFSQVYRYRRVSDPDTRRRSRLFAIGVAVNLLGFIAINVALDLGNFDRPDYPAVPAVLVSVGISLMFFVSGLVFMVILAIAILREQLFGIQVVLNRTLVYAGLTALVIACYSGATVLLTHVLQTQGGIAGIIGVGIATIAIYPARSRLQRAVDRLVYGQRDEPWAVLSTLSRRFEGAVPAGQVLDEVVTSITHALKLPYAAVFIGEGETPAASSGTPAPISRRIPLVHNGEPLGALAVAAWPGATLRKDDIRLLEDVAHQAGAAVNAVRLTVELQQSRGRLVAAREEERRRLRRDLHDGLGPRLAGMMMRVETARDALPEGHAASTTLGALETEMSAAIADIRRLVYGLRPPALDDFGLVEALRHGAAAFEPGRMAVAIEAATPLPPLPAAVEVAAFRIAQEAITNAVRHSSGSRCTVTFAANGHLELVVEDDGHGLAPGYQPGVGLRSMRERAEEVGGTLDLAPGERGGLRLAATLPLAHHPNPEPAP